MSGLIWAGIGQGISDAGTTLGGYMLKAADRDADREDRQEERRREREEDRKWREEQARLNREASADRRNSGNSGSREYTQDEQLAMAIESGQFKSQAEIDAFKAAMKSGDYSAFAKDITRADVKETGDPYNPEIAVSTEKGYPPGFEKDVQAKARALANIARESVQGKNLKDVNEGRQKGLEFEVGQGILKGEMDPRAGGQAVAAMGGKPLFGGDSNVTRNMYTGATGTTEVGKSQIRENDAQAGKARADAGKESKPDIAGVSANVRNLLDLAKAAENEGNDAEAKRLRAEATRLSLGAADKKVPKPEGAAAGAKPSEADAHAAARDAIARGASKDAVNKRLRENGYKPLP